MTRSFFKLCQIYTLLALAVAVMLSPLPYSVFSLILLATWIFAAFRPLNPRISLALVVSTIFSLPVLFEPVWGYLPVPVIAAQIAATVTALPTIYLLDFNLKQYPKTAMISIGSNGRYVTTVSRTLFICALTILLIALILNHASLLFTAAVFILYLLVILGHVLMAVPKQPVYTNVIRKRVIAGTEAEVSLQVTSKAAVELYARFSPVDSWVNNASQLFTLNGNGTEFKLSITPPLAGPANPRLQVSVIDPWGFIQTNQTLEPIELQVIPRARYAEWLAMKYLENAGPGGSVSTAMSSRLTPAPKRGTEYYDSRNYQPGDPLTRIDWKHSLKQNQLIIKEYVEGGEQTAIIAVNLSVRSAEEADKLAFNLITTALTLSYEAIPTSLAAYDHEKVVLTTVAREPGDVLKQAISLVKDIAMIELPDLVLQPPDLRKLRRNVALLSEATAEPAKKLSSLLEFELTTIEDSARKNPATLALMAAAQRTQTPAIIIPLSQRNHDAEALMVTLEKLSRRGFTTLVIA